MTSAAALLGRAVGILLGLVARGIVALASGIDRVTDALGRGIDEGLRRMR